MREAGIPAPRARRSRRRRDRWCPRPMVQKQVGQTMVQLAQVRQRSATSSQRGCSRLRASSSCRSSARMAAAHAGAPSAATTASALAISSLRRRAMRQRRRAPPCPPPSPASTRKDAGRVDELGQREIETRRRPSGPCSIETQKQVPPASPQLTATMKALLAPRPVMRVDMGAAEEDAVLDGDGVQLAGAHADEGEALVATGSAVDAHVRRRRARALHRRCTGGCRNFFQECGPTA